MTLLGEDERYAQAEASTQTQLMAMSATAPTRIHMGMGVGSNGTGHRATAHRVASGAPTTKRSPKPAASGFAANAARNSPLRKAVAARVVPQVGQGIPVMDRKTHGRRFGAAANHSGLRARAEAAAANHRNASWRSSLVAGRVVTVRRRLLPGRP